MKKKLQIRKIIVTIVILLFFATAIIPTVANVSDKNNSLNETKQLVFTKNVIETPSFNFLDLPFKPNSQFNSKNQYEIIENKQPVSNEDIYFTNPLNNDVLRAGDTIIINGTITGEKFKYYKIKYGEGRNPLKWYTTGISLTNNGESPVENGTVAIWDTSHITEPGFFTLKITTHLKRALNAKVKEYFKSIFLRNHPMGTFIKFEDNDLIPSFLDKKVKNIIKNIYLDPTLKEGWPQRIKWDKIPWYKNQGGHIWAGYVEPVVSDINNDGDMEIVVHKAGDPPTIYAFNSDGSLVEGWPAPVNSNPTSYGNTGSPTIADIDNDGFKEILVNDFEGVFIFNHNGSFLRKIKLKINSEPMSSLESIVYDLNNDGNMEIVKKYMSFQERGYRLGVNLTVLDIYGNMLPGWPRMHNDYEGPDGRMYPCGIEGMPAIGNFDNDSDLEIVVCANRNVFDDPSKPNETNRVEGRIIVYNLDGSIIDGFPLDIYRRFCGSPPVVGDLNNDGKDEIAFVPTNGIYIIDRYGNNLSGWPQLIDEKIRTSPVLADFDNDGYLEIVISTLGSHSTYIFNYQGNLLSGWPQQTSWNDYRSPIVGDVNGDGNADILTTAGNGFTWWCPGDGGVYAWNLNGNPIDGFPKVTEQDAQASAVIADIDNDGLLNLIASSNWDEDLIKDEHKHRSTIYVWELDSDFNEDTIEWPMFHHDTMYTGRYTFPIMVSGHKTIKRDEIR